MNRIATIIIGTLLTLLATDSGAKTLPLPKDLPPYGADKPIPVPRIDKHTLANGMTVWIVVDAEGVPKVNYVLAVRGGKASDPRTQNGLSDIMAGALEEGTRTRSARQIAQELQALGAGLGAAAGREGTTVTAGGPTSNAAGILALLADVVRNPIFPEAEIELAKTNAQQGLLAAKADPGYQAGVAFDRAVYGDHVYGTGEPTAETIASITPQMARELHARRFRPERALLVVSGRADAGQTLKLVKKYFGDWPRGSGPVEADVPAAAREVTPARVFIAREGSVQSAIRVGRPAFNAADPIQAKADVAETILGGGFGSRLFDNLREQKGYTYGAYAGFGALRNGGSLVAAADVRNEVTGPAIGEINREFQRMVDEPVSADELARSQRYIAGVYLFRNQMRGSVAGSLANLWLEGRAPEELGEYVNKVRAVSVADVQDVARKYFRPQDQSIVVVGDPSVAEQLKPYGSFGSSAK